MLNINTILGKPMLDFGRKNALKIHPPGHVPGAETMVEYLLAKGAQAVWVSWGRFAIGKVFPYGLKL